MLKALTVHFVRKELAPLTESGFSQGFFSLFLMEFGFLVIVAFGLLRCGFKRHLIFINIIDVTALKLLNENKKNELDDDTVFELN